MSERRVTARQKAAVTERARNCCEYCRSQADFSPQTFSVEHIVPRQRGGPTTLENLALSCQACNNHKYTRTEGRDPVTGAVVSLFHPRQQRWRDHFSWNRDCTLIVDLTPIGRATVAALHMNRNSLLNLRRALCAWGEHPPQEPEEPEQ